ncbi:VOC family protein [Larkinella humicola]|uniref:VOC family protein n=1 Tax=Larkinella humicola TaxID=2607654 RepID=A0A5N1J6F6_9BACT|nr:VOC family protein [Larkinella humicola]KAA9346297.1 VOC family protein [Larkinella humicola]
MTFQPKVTPFLWFDNQAEEAMNFYVSIFKNSAILSLNRMGADGPVMSGSFQLEGQKFMTLNAGPHFKFNEAVSFFVNCDTQDEVDEFWEKLSKGGSTSRCGWLKDQFGLSWQIVPTILGELLYDKDPAKSQRVMQALMTMEKIDIATLLQAAGGLYVS